MKMYQWEAMSMSTSYSCGKKKIYLQYENNLFFKVWWSSRISGGPQLEVSMSLLMNKSPNQHNILHFYIRSNVILFPQSCFQWLQICFKWVFIVFSQLYWHIVTKTHHTMLSQIDGSNSLLLTYTARSPERFVEKKKEAIIFIYLWL